MVVGSVLVSFEMVCVLMIVMHIAGMQVLNRPEHSGKFNFTTEFPYYKEVLYKPDFRNKKLGKPVIFDMDMSAGDFVALFYLLKVPVEVLNLKVSGFSLISFTVLCIIHRGMAANGLIHVLSN